MLLVNVDDETEMIGCRKTRGVFANVCSNKLGIYVLRERVGGVGGWGGGDNTLNI